MLKVTFLLFIILVQAALAKEHRVPTAGGSILFETDEKEESQRKFFGADLWFTGEVVKEKRNVMSIVYSTKDVQLDPQVNDSEFAKHKAEMTKFAKERGYSKLEFHPYKFKKVNEELAYHSFAWSYQKDGFEFLEESYYVECNHLLFIAKATTNLHSLNDQSKFKKIIESARCLK